MSYTLVQSKAATTSTATTKSISMTSTAAGAYIPCVFVVPAGTTITNVTDNQGNTYTLRSGSDDSVSAFHAAFYDTSNAAAGVTSITAHYGSSVLSTGAAREYSGVLGPVDQVQAATGNSGTPSSTTPGPTTHASELVLGWCVYGQPHISLSAGSGYGNLWNAGTTSWDIAFEDKLQSSTATQTANFSLAPSESWIAGVTTYGLTATTVGISIAPSSVTGGNSAVGTVTLSDPAPGGGTVVTLSSDNAAVTVPGSVTVLAGQTTATFTCSTTPVANAVTANVTASISGSSDIATLTVNPPGLSSVTLSPTSVTAGSSSTATLTLTGNAPVGGTSVLVSSNKTAAVVSTPVVVPAGQSSVTFPVTTIAGSSPVVARITCTKGIQSVHADLTITQVGMDTIYFVATDDEASQGITNLCPAIATAGNAFVGRYLNPMRWGPGNNCLTLLEVQKMKATSILIASIWQRTIDGNSFSAIQGEADAGFALTIAKSIGQVVGSCIYFAVNFDATSGQLSSGILPYFAQVASLLRAQGFTVGVIGSGLTCTTLKNTGSVDKTWLASNTAWNGSSSYTDYDVAQGSYQFVAGIGCYSDAVASGRDAGLW